MPGCLQFKRWACITSRSYRMVKLQSIRRDTDNRENAVMIQVLIAALALGVGLGTDKTGDLEPSVAASAVRVFIGDANAPCKVTGPFNDIPSAVEGRHYRVRVEGPSAGSFSVS